MRIINKIVTSKEAILKTCRELVAKQGLQSLDMRSVAKKCNVSVGSVYNYFPSKADLIAATIQDVWYDIFHMGEVCKADDSFPEYVERIFDSVQVGTSEYCHFFTAHSLSFANEEKGKAREVMDGYFEHMKAGLLSVLEGDGKVKEFAFSSDITKQEFVEFVFASMIMLLMKKESSCQMLLEIIKRFIYTTTCI
ncbi:MAG: TetR/AcrR family transcriptional regulator [Lachnospiraceae bacterium]